MQYAEAAQLAQQEVDVLRAKLHRIEEEYNAKEMLWTQERARLEGALSSAHLASRSTDASSSAQELSRLTDEVAELKSQLTDTRDAGALWQYESRAEAAEERAQHATDRAEAAEAAAAEARREAAKVAKELETHRAALYREAEALREKAASAEKEAAAAIAELASHKTAAARAASEARTAEQQLAVALAAQAEAVRERNALQARLDQMGVELERARRETEAAENRAMAVHGRAAGGEGGRA